MSGEKSRFSQGGFAPRFRVSRTDGKPCRPEARYMVLDGSGADPHAVLALRGYAASVRADNPLLAADLDAMIGLTDGNDTRVVTGGVWPPEFAQHDDAG